MGCLLGTGSISEMEFLAEGGWDMNRGRLAEGGWEIGKSSVSERGGVIERG
jgi:hypothetical protein